MPLKKWSTLSKGGYKCDLIRKIRNLLEIISGNEIEQMFNDLLSKDEKKNISSKYVSCLNGIGKIYSKKKFFKPNIKRTILKEIRESGIIKQEAQQLGICFNYIKFLQNYIP